MSKSELQKKATQLLKDAGFYKDSSWKQSQFEKRIIPTPQGNKR